MKTHPTKALLAVAVCLSVFTTSHAVVISKDPAGTDLTAGASWAGGNAPTSADVATWGDGSLGGALTMGSDQSWGGIDIQSATAAISISGSGVLTLGTGGITVAAGAQDLTLTNNVIFSGATSNVNVGAGRTVKLNGVKTFNAGTVTTLNGEGVVEIGASQNSTGAGDVVLNSGTLFMNMQGGTHDRTGNTIINGGIVKSTTSLNFFGTGTVYFNGGTIGSGSSTRRIFANAMVIGGDFAIGGSGLGAGAIQFSGNLDFTGGSRVITVNSTFELTGSGGNGTLVKQGSANLVLKSGDFSTMNLHVAQGNVQLGGNGVDGAASTTYIGSLSGEAGTTLSSAYNLPGSSNSARTLSVNQTVDGVFAGTITQGSGRTVSLVKEGSATLTLSGTNAYTGGTTINNGTLVAAAAAALGTGAVQANGGTLATTVANVNTGAFNLAGGALVLNGVGAGTITLAAGQDFNFTAGLWKIDLASGLDQILGSGAGSEFTFSGGVIDLGGGNIDYSQTYDLIAGFESIVIGDGVGITGYDTANWQASINANGDLSFTAVPEPSTYGLLGAGALAAAAMVRRRRRKASDASPVTE